VDTRARFMLAGGLATGIALAIADSYADRKRYSIKLDKEMPASASEVVEIIKQVENEKDLIPIIADVIVHEASEDCVSYSVRTETGIPASARYKKCWDDTPAVYWWSESGTAGFHHAGEITFTEENGRTIAHLRSEHWLTAPIIGRAIGPAILPAIRSELQSWLDNIAKKLEEKQ